MLSQEGQSHFGIPVVASAEAEFERIKFGDKWHLRVQAWDAMSNIWCFPLGCINEWLWKQHPHSPWERPFPTGFMLGGKMWTGNSSQANPAHPFSLPEICIVSQRTNGLKTNGASFSLWQYPQGRHCFLSPTFPEHSYCPFPPCLPLLGPQVLSWILKTLLPFFDFS